MKSKKVLLAATVQSHIGQFHKPLMRLLKENGCEIHVAARDNLAEKNGLRLEYPDKVFSIPFARSPLNVPALFKAAKALKRVLRENTYDVIHCNTPVAGVVTRLAARKYRKKGTRVFYTAHGFHFYHGAPKKNWIIYYPIERWMARYTDVLVTITDEDYRFASRRFPCKVVRMHGVGANSERFFPVSEEEKQAIRTALGLGAGPILLNIGELLPNKNQKTAVAAMSKVLETYPDARLLIAGNGPEKENLEQQIISMGLSEHVTLLGYTTKADQYVKACDVLIACSYREGMPLNIMEAMLCGKPVVASHNRGHNELVGDGVTGYLVPADDSEAYAEKICVLLRGGADAMGRAGRARVQPYTAPAVREELRQLYGTAFAGIYREDISKS